MSEQNRGICTHTEPPTWVEGRLCAYLCVELALSFSLLWEMGRRVETKRYIMEFICFLSA